VLPRLAGGGNWCLALKANQASLLADARGCFTGLGAAYPETVTEETGHGRSETRKAIVVSARSLEVDHEFPGLKGFGRPDRGNPRN